MLLAVLRTSILRSAVLALRRLRRLLAQPGSTTAGPSPGRPRVPGVVLRQRSRMYSCYLGLSMWLSLSPNAITSADRSHYWTFVHPLAGIRRGGAGSRREREVAARATTTPAAGEAAYRFYAAPR